LLRNAILFQVPDQFIQPAVVDTWPQVPGMWPDNKLWFQRARFAKTLSQSLIDDVFEWPARFPREFRKTLRNLIFKSQGCPHPYILMRTNFDVKMPAILQEPARRATLNPWLPGL
jgi:hypothetical protein